MDQTIHRFLSHMVSNRHRINSNLLRSLIRPRVLLPQASPSFPTRNHLPHHHSNFSLLRGKPLHRRTRMLHLSRMVPVRLLAFPPISIKLRARRPLHNYPCAPVVSHRLRDYRKDHPSVLRQSMLSRCNRCTKARFQDRLTSPMLLSTINWELRHRTGAHLEAPPMEILKHPLPGLGYGRVAGLPKLTALSQIAPLLWMTCCLVLPKKPTKRK